MTKIGGSLMVVVVAVAGSLSAGCGSGYSQYCQDQMDCRNGNDRDVEACEIDASKDEDVASLEGCDDQWAQLVDCRESDGRCTTDHKWDETRCDAERDRWHECID